MGHIDSSGSDIDVDLESGGTTSEEEGSINLSLSSERVVGLGETTNRWNSCEISVFKKKSFKEKSNRSSSKKPPKPPRPPGGVSLDAADMKLVREISELSMLKRKRMERMKTLKKMKMEKSSSSLSSIVAMLVTVIFFFVIIFQGLLGSRV